MSVLLRQPHGFEGFGASKNCSHRTDLAIAENEHETIVRLESASLPLPSCHENGGSDDNAVARVDELARPSIVTSVERSQARICSHWLADPFAPTMNGVRLTANGAWFEDPGS